MEFAFMRRKKEKEAEEKKKAEAQNGEETDEDNLERQTDSGIPVPAKRKSLKKTDENR